MVEFVRMCVQVCIIFNFAPSVLDMPAERDQISLACENWRSDKETTTLSAATEHFTLYVYHKLCLKVSSTGKLMLKKIKLKKKLP